MRLRRTARALAAVVAVLAAVIVACAVYTSVATRRAERAFPARGRFVVVEGVRLRYAEAGSGAPVVLLHGNPGFLEDWAPDDPAGPFAVLARGHRVLAFDRPGHGYSARPSADGTTPLDQARLLHAALVRLGVARPVLVGHSWGGGLALLYALAYPGEVGGLVLVGARAYPAAGRPDPVYALNRLPGVGALLRHTLMLPVGRGLLDRRLAAAYAPDAPRPEHASRARALWLRPGQVAATVWDTENLQRSLAAASARYGAIGGPVVVLVGDGDRGIDDSRRLARAVPCAALVVAPRTGHELPLTRPDLLADAVRRAFEGGPPRAGAPCPSR